MKRGRKSSERTKFKQGGRYDVSSLPEAQFEPGSNRRVLSNRLGITTKREIDRAEAAALARATDSLVRTYDQEHRFSARDICYFHEIWLGEIYGWAGQYRNVNVSKDGFSFAAANRVPALMETFEKKVLLHHTPCRSGEQGDVARALAETHTELMLIHPFREGNGRVGRILATLMALQAGLPFLDFSAIRGKKKQEYFAAVRAGLDQNYEPMKMMFFEVIERSLRVS